MEEVKKRRFYERITSIYRLVVMNDDTFEEKISLKLSPLGLFILVGSIVIVLIVGVTSLIAFTPLREYVPGYADVRIDRQVRLLLLRADSLEKEVETKTVYINNINNVISGREVAEKTTEKAKTDTSKKYNTIVIKASKEDSILRNQIELHDKYNLSLNKGDDKNHKNDINNFFFFSPLKGIITNSFNVNDEHYGIDITAQENEAIKAALDGTVILSTWTSETGYVIQIQHENNLVSVYKHNSALLKKVGQFVKAGEAIAIIGNSGEMTSGPHLHFELWYNGTPIDPQEYMVF